MSATGAAWVVDGGGATLPACVACTYRELEARSIGDEGLARGLASSAQPTTAVGTGLTCIMRPSTVADRPTCDLRAHMRARLAPDWWLTERLRPLLVPRRREQASTGYLEFIQQQEEEALQAALAKLQDQQQQGPTKT